MRKSQDFHGRLRRTIKQVLWSLMILALFAVIAYAPVSHLIKVGVVLVGIIVLYSYIARQSRTAQQSVPVIVEERLSAGGGRPDTHSQSS